MRRTIRGDSADEMKLSRAGEGATVVIRAPHCPCCGGRVQSIRGRYGESTGRLHCRGCGKVVPA